MSVRRGTNRGQDGFLVNNIFVYSRESADKIATILRDNGGTWSRRLPGGAWDDTAFHWINEIIGQDAARWRASR